MAFNARKKKFFIFLRKFRARLNKFSNFNHKQHNVDDKCLFINQLWTYQNVVFVLAILAVWRILFSFENFSFSNRRKIIIWGKAGKIVCVLCVYAMEREKERKKLCDVDWRDDDDDGVLCVLEADGFSSFLLCSINDLDRDGLSNHNSSWYCPRWTWTYTHTIFNLITRLLWLFLLDDVVRGRCDFLNNFLSHL